MFDVAVLLIVFNRPEKTAAVVKVLEKVKPSKIFVAADGPRENNREDIMACNEVRAIFDELSWPCEVVKFYREKNLGVSLNPRTALKEFFEINPEGIILEDDCVPGTDFFYFCRELLERYRHDERIFTINGGNLGFDEPLKDSYFFSRFMNMTGWATWRRSCMAVDYDLNKWRSVKHPLLYLYKHLRQNLFDLDINWYKFWKYRFDKTVSGEDLKWWDYQWIFHQLSHRKLSIVPAKNLVTNIGFDGLGSNTTDHENPAANLPVKPIAFPLTHPLKLKINRYYEEHFVKWVWCYHKRLPRIFYLKRAVKQLFE